MSLVNYESMVSPSDLLSICCKAGLSTELPSLQMAPINVIDDLTYVTSVLKENESVTTCKTASTQKQKGKVNSESALLRSLTCPLG